MTFVRPRRLSRSGLTLFAVGLVTLLAACGSATAVSHDAAPSSATAPGGGSPTPAPTAAPVYTTVAPAKAGESSFRVVTPCDGGTVTLKAYPHGAGVGMTAVLRNPKDTRWLYSAGVTPAVNPDQSVTMPEGTVHNGELVARANNITGPLAMKGAKGLNRAWPEDVAIGLEGPVDCGTLAYLDAEKGTFQTHGLIVHILRSGTVSVVNSPLAVGGARRISVSVTAPGAGQHRARTVQAAMPPGTSKWDPQPDEATAAFQGLASLEDFTSMTVTVTRNGRRTTWMTFSRKP